MHRYINSSFHSIEGWASGQEFSDVEFINCRFSRCHFSSVNFDIAGQRDFVSLRSVARRIKFVNSVIEDVIFVGPGVVEDSCIDGLRVLKHFQTLGTVFKHVVVRGAVDKLVITPLVDIMGDYPKIQDEFDRANREYYETVDWALDLSDASFKDCDIRGIPSRLIKRDAETQVILTRNRAMAGGWREIDLSGTHWAGAIKLFLEDGYIDRLLIAPKQAPNFKQLLEGIRKLRIAGVVEPD